MGVSRLGGGAQTTWASRGWEAGHRGARKSILGRSPRPKDCGSWIPLPHPAAQTAQTGARSSGAPNSGGTDQDSPDRSQSDPQTGSAQSQQSKRTGRAHAVQFEKLAGSPGEAVVRCEHGEALYGHSAARYGHVALCGAARCGTARCGPAIGTALSLL